MKKGGRNRCSFRLFPASADLLQLVAGVLDGRAQGLVRDLRRAVDLGAAALVADSQDLDARNLSQSLADLLDRYSGDNP